MVLSILTKLHRWLGLFFGIWLVLVALTGTLLLYKVELLQWRYPQLQLEQLPTEQTAAGVFDRYNEGYAYMPREANPWLEIVMPSGARHYYNANGEQILERPYLSDLVGFMVEFHHHLLLKDLGKDLLGYMGIAGLILLTTGIIRWWPRHWSRRLLAIRWVWPWHRSFAATLFQLHKVIGSVLFVPVLIGMLTGTAIMYAAAVSAGLTALAPEQQPQPITAEEWQQVAPAHNWQERFERAHQLLPDHQPQLVSLSNLSLRMTFPGEWHPNGRSHVQFDAGTGAVTSVYDLRYDSKGYQVSQMIFPVHVAAVGGLAWFIVVLLGGLALIILPVSGIYFWCWRQYKKRCRL
ncbi:PepSY domain-containing protein [Pseudidiomarina marina]|uniref:PepSY domain-containing protein n=1 Tax=Pseudidiomarina marina TaxID=502366 RepID=A0A432YG77_9GAMM|nr:PepSY-associated TM helix domain-containing protein [Pseudidiomarina marina]RUO59952.1 PepSY domain-containing protein [Pseudidiomarina marina]